MNSHEYILICAYIQLAAEPIKREFWFHKSLSKANSPIKYFSLFCLIEIHLNINNEWVYSNAVQQTDQQTATINHLVNMNNNFNHSELRRRAHMMNCILWMTIWVWVQLSAAANECECMRVRISVFTWQSLLFYCDLLANQKERQKERGRERETR